MIKVVGMHRFDEGQVIRDLAQIGQPVREFSPGISVLGKGKARTENGGVRLDEGVALTLDHGGRNGFTLHFLELGFVVEELELAGSASHKEIDHPLGLDREAHEVGLAGCSEGFLGEQ